MIWTACLVSVGFVFGARVEEAVETGWGFASIVFLVALVLLTVFAWWRINQIAVPAPTVEEQPT